MHYILFTTTRCPKCPEFKQFIENNVSFPGKLLDETMSEFTDMIVEFNATSAPLIIIFDSQDNEVLRTNETYEIQEFLGSL